MTKSTELTLAKATGKIADALGIDPTNTGKAMDAHRQEAAIVVETERYQRELLDLNAEFVRRRDLSRRNHLRQIAMISSQAAE